MSVTHADFTIERRYGYTPAQTFSAFADPELRRQWFANPGGWDNAEWELDFRVGGGELSSGGHPGGRYNEFRSRFHEIVENERIIFAYDLLHDHRLISVSLTTIEFRPTATARGCCSPSRARSSTGPAAPPSASTAPAAARRARPLPRRGAGAMSLTLHEHPFASYCWKALIALYERDVDVERHFVGDAQDRARLARAVADGEHPRAGRRRGLTLPESTRDHRVPRPPRRRAAADPRRPAAPPCRRGCGTGVIDGHVMTPMQKIVADALRPEGRARSRTASPRRAPSSTAPTRCSTTTSARDGWLAGPAFTLADCAAAPGAPLRASGAPLGRGRARRTDARTSRR